MHRIPALLVFLLVGSSLATPVAAQEETNSWEQWQLILPYFSSTTDENGTVGPIFSNDQLVLLDEYREGPLVEPSPEVLAVLEQAQPVFDLLRESSNADYFDPGNDRSQGFMMLLPHLAPMRAATRLMSAQARASAAMGDIDGMIDVLAMSSQLGTQAGQDGLIISSLVSSSCFMLMDQDLGGFIGSGLIGQDQAATLLEQMTNLQLDDPMNFSGAVEGERDMMLQFIDQMIDSTQDEREDILGEFNTIGLDIPANLDIDQLRKEREVADGIFDQFAAGFNDPDRQRGQALIEDAQRQVEELAESGNWMIGAIMPTMLRILDARDRVDRMIADRLRQLDGLASGRRDPESMRNAAIIWLEAGKAAANLDPDVQAAAIELIGLPEAWQSPMPPTGRLADLPEPQPTPMHAAEARMTWASATDLIQPLITAGLDAATIGSADFSITRENRPFIDRPYIGQLRAISRVLLADAMFRLHAWTETEADSFTPGDRELADINVLLGAEDIAAVIALIGHLQADALVAHALLGSVIHQEVSNVIDAYVQAIARREREGKAAPAIDRMLLSRLRWCHDQVPRTDAFGRDAAMAAELPLLCESEWAWRVREAGGNVEMLRAELADLSLDQLAAVLTYLDARGPLDQVNVESPTNLDRYSETMRQNMAMHLEAQPPIGALARCDDYLALAPAWTGAGPGRYAVTRAFEEAVREKPSTFSRAFKAMNLDPTIPVQQVLMEAYGRIGDTDETLRMRAPANTGSP